MHEEGSRGTASPRQLLPLLAPGDLPVGKPSPGSAHGLSGDGARLAKVVQPSPAKTDSGQEVWRGDGGREVVDGRAVEKGPRVVTSEGKKGEGGGW